MEIKKITAVITAAALALTLTGCGSSGFEYEISSELGGTVITGYNGDAENIKIPEKPGGKMVVGIGDSAFKYMDGIKAVTILDGVTSIDRNAFSECHSLESVKIPDGVTEIGTMAFFGCTALKNIDIPDSVTDLGEDTFNQSGLESIKLPQGITEIGSSLFLYCSNLKSIDIPEGVTQIGYAAFNFCESLTDVTIPDSVTAIETSFQGCEKIQVTYKNKTYDYEHIADLYDAINNN